jgi:hypothetical protein
VRARVEHVFGDQKNGMGTGIVRTIANRKQHVKSRGLESITIPFEPDRRSFIALDVATVNSAHIWDYRALNLLHENGAFEQCD